MDSAIPDRAVTELEGPRWLLENDQLRMEVSLNSRGLPVLSSLVSACLPDLDWAGGVILGPVIQIAGQVYEPGEAVLSFTRAEVGDAGSDLILHYRGTDGLEASHHLEPSPHRAAWRSWTVVRNTGQEAIVGLCRFDAANLVLGVSEARPHAAYLLGWLDGPRADAPGRPPVPFPYPSWIPQLLYGNGAPTPPPPPAGGWTSAILRLIKEPLTRLPLRSGKRSTYDNYPWVAVLDPDREGGIFQGLQWSGTWEIDVEHHPENRTVSMYACSDGCEHQLGPGESVVSPAAFTGFFAGDWEEASNACRRYVAGEIMPRPSTGHPPVRYNAYLLGQPKLPRYDPSLLRSAIDTAAEVGVECVLLDAMWWEASQDHGDFSIGLGDFSAARSEFPDGLRAVSDYVHERGMGFGLWSEFERVDIRTANRGPNPWSPDWLVPQQGHPYSSWCQHVYMLCLGRRAASEWALENLSWAVEAYGLDWLKIDGNEWAVCDDVSHDHDAGDGEWAQIQGLYHVLGGLRERFPELVIENCAGGPQRADFGMARYCLTMQGADRTNPSLLERRYCHGTGSMYPCHSLLTSIHSQAQEVSPQRLEWRLLSRMMGTFNNHLDLMGMDDARLDVVRRAVATYKRLRPSLHGDRYVLAEPGPVVEPELEEAGTWEVYEYLSPKADLVSVFFFRGTAPESELRVLLRGLESGARYKLTSHAHPGEEMASGAELMQTGLICRLEECYRADVVILTRV